MWHIFYWLIFLYMFLNKFFEFIVNNVFMTVFHWLFLMLGHLCWQTSEQEFWWACLYFSHQASSLQLKAYLEFGEISKLDVLWKEM